MENKQSSAAASSSVDASIMTVYSKASSSSSSVASSRASSPSFHYFPSEDDRSETSSSISEVFLAAPAAVTTASSVSSSIYSSSFLTRRILRPPETVVLEPQPPFVPYAQLCFHKDCNTMSTMLVGASSKGRNNQKDKFQANLVMADVPNLTLSLSSSDDDESGSGWSTGYSSENTDYHHSHGVVWISREWWNRPTHDQVALHQHQDDELALLPGLHTASSSEESATSVSLKSCAGKLFSCNHMRKADHARPGVYHHHHRVAAHQTTTKIVEEGRAKKDSRFYGYELLNH